MQANAGIIDQNIDTSESIDGLRDLRLALGGICDVACEGERAPPPLRYQRRFFPLLPS